MRLRSRFAQVMTVIPVVFLALGQQALAGPPAPPILSPPPATPVGGTEVTIFTALAVAGYGYWKSRK